MRFRGELLGAIYVDHRLRRGNFDDGDLAHVEEFAELAALAVAHARALDEVRRQAQRLETQHAQLAEMFARIRPRSRHCGAPSPTPSTGEATASSVRRRPCSWVYKLVDLLADTDVPSSCTARAHRQSSSPARSTRRCRRTGPFVAENCGAIPRRCSRAWLFGTERPFTLPIARASPFRGGARRHESFLDEVVEMSPACRRSCCRCAGGRGPPRRENVLAARTCASSRRAISISTCSSSRAKFRRDLYYRIHVVRIELPPLRERQADIATLVQHFSSGAARPCACCRRRCSRLQGYGGPATARARERSAALNRTRRGPCASRESLAGDPRRHPAVDPDDLRSARASSGSSADLITRALEGRAATRRGPPIPRSVAVRPAEDAAQTRAARRGA